MRFLLQWADADYYNPVSQFFVKVTHLPLRWLRRAIPTLGRIDTASLVLMWSLQMLAGYLMFSLQGASIAPAALAAWALLQLIELVLNVFFYLIMASTLLSWLGQRRYNPGMVLIHNLAAPLMAPARRWFPPIGGIDLSPMIPLIGIEVAKMLILPPLHQLFLYLNL